MDFFLSSCYHEYIMQARPFVKWVGGKTQLLDEIRNQYPSGLGKTITKYAEPFVGGGAVLFDILNCYELDKVYISDINAELVNAYTVIRDDAISLSDALEKYRAEYLSFSDVMRREYFYKKRERFNELKENACEDTESASLFIFLNKTCFNGLYRVNSKGLFNVPFNGTKNPSLPDREMLLSVSEKLRNTDIKCGDYKEVEDFIDEKTFVYFDPPYRPLSKTAYFTSYSEKGFGDSEQIELGQFIQKIARKGAKIVLSNSDPKNIDTSDNFFDNLYEGFNIQRIKALRMVNSDATKRGEISELLVCNY